MWENKKELQIYDKEKKDYFESVVVLTHCVDEKTGLVLFVDVYYKIRNVIERLFTVEKLEFNNVKDEEFYIPDNVKFIVKPRNFK